MKKILRPKYSAILFSQLAHAARHALPYRDVLTILAKDPELFGEQTPAIEALAQALNGGASLSEGMTKLERLFPPELPSLLRQAEIDAFLPETLETLADDQFRASLARPALIDALAWPGTLMSIAFVLLFLSMVFVIPEFKSVYTAFGADLPGPTLLAIHVSDLFVEFSWLWLTALMLLILAFASNKAPAWLTTGFKVGVSQIPYVRNYLAKQFMARMIGWLHRLHDKPALLLAAIRLIRADTDVPLIRETVSTLEARLNDGQTLAKALLDLPPLPQRLGLFMSIVEMSGNGDSGIAQLTDQSLVEESTAMNRLVRGTTLTAYALIGGTVGFLVIAMYLPIFKLGQVV